MKLFKTVSYIKQSFVNYNTQPGSSPKPSEVSQTESVSGFHTYDDDQSIAKRWDTKTKNRTKKIYQLGVSVPEIEKYEPHKS